MSSSITVLATLRPVDMDDLKLHIRVRHADEDDLIRALQETAVSMWESQTRRQLMVATYEETFRGFEDEMELRPAPLAAVASIEYLDTDDAEQTLSTDVYGVDAALEPAVVYRKSLQDWPALSAFRNPVTVTFTAGYTTLAAVPEDIKSAIKLMVAHLFEHREAVAEPVGRGGFVDLPMGWDALLAPYSVSEVV